MACGNWGHSTSYNSVHTKEDYHILHITLHFCSHTDVFHQGFQGADVLQHSRQQFEMLPRSTNLLCEGTWPKACLASRRYGMVNHRRQRVLIVINPIRSLFQIRESVPYIMVMGYKHVVIL